ncbi:MAG: tetratricopeptide repeat protein [bacterium]|nr:tetratricopeptide repeat protein [bacterium]
MTARLLLLALVWAGVTMSAAPSLSPAQRIRLGNEAFAQSNYEAAVQAYAGAQVDLPESAEVAYNLGISYYRQGKYDKALTSLQKALATDDAQLEARVQYTIGNTLVQQGKLRESLDAYKQCLVRDRDDQDAKYNIEYVQRKLKELASKKKDEQEKDPLNKLLKELERLITLQAENIVGTKALLEQTNTTVDIAAPLEHVRTNEVNYTARTYAVREGFRDLRTNLPPERLNATASQAQPAPPGAAQPQVQMDEPTRALAAVYQLLGQAAEAAHAAQTGALPAGVSATMSNAVAGLRALEMDARDNLVKQYAGNGQAAVQNIQRIFDAPRNITPADVERASKEFNALLENIHKELMTRIQAQAQTGTNATEKTMAQKIDNAVRYLAGAHQRLTSASAALAGTWTNAPPDQKMGLEYLIKARKEFDDKQQQQEQKQDKQDQDKNKDKDKDKNKDKDKDKDKDKNKDQNKDQNKKQDKQQQQPEQEKQQQEKQQQPQMSKQQAEQMLRSVDEDQRNRRKAHKRELGGATVRPVDVDL